MNSDGMESGADALTVEKSFLDSVSKTYVTSLSPQDRLIRQLVVRTFAPFVPGGVGLELGCSDGYMTELLAGLVDKLDVVDGSKTFLEEAEKRRLPKVRTIYSLFEEFVPEAPYDCVFATYVLEHVIDVGRVLKMVRSVLKPNGLLFVAVPNARALSRQLAIHMGLLPDLKALTQNDMNHGHRRVYDRVSLNRDLAEAGFSCISQGGILLKPLADFQMDKMINAGILTEVQLEGLYSLGFEYPDLCGTIYSVCGVKGRSGIVL